MQRQSDKHGPRADDALERQSRSLLQGAPGDSRADENREDETVSPAGEEPGREKQELARWIPGSVFPAGRVAITEGARRLHAPVPVIERLEQLPEGTFEGFPDVWDALEGRSN